MEKVTIVGLGYVGLPLALRTASKGFDVTGIDLSNDKVEKINQQLDPIHDHYVADHIAGTTLKARTDFESIADSDIIVVCVPTPVKEAYQPDLSIVEGAVRSIAKNLQKKSLIVIESTINPGVCDEVVIPLIEKESGRKVNEGFFVSHCPERINPGDQMWNVENIPRVVGSSNSEGLHTTVAFYRAIVDADIKPMASIKEAEAVKVVENSFRDVNIAFVNELAMSFTRLGINVRNVIDGAATKPFAFMAHYPSIGVGGHCIPVDPYYLIEYARDFGFEHEFLSLARNINNHMPDFTVERLIDGLNEAGLPIKDTKIAVLGLSYKSNVADDRESPSYDVINILQSKGARVTVFDPYILDKSTVQTLDEALNGQDAIVVATGHDEFKQLVDRDLPVKVLVDGKNIFGSNVIAQKGVIYRGIGT
jgi:UDP-N-acetyl-D-glucosamine dehydrogenase